MNPDARVAAVAKLGFTGRQAGFLTTVMVHSGVCLGRQYCQYARIVRGQKMYDFFAALVARRVATAYRSAHRHTNVYHVHGKALYRAIGEVGNRNRKPVTLARAVERLILLDAVLAQPELRWLGTEREKVEYFRSRTRLRDNELPSLAFSGTNGTTVRYFPDKLPIGTTPDHRAHVFLYVVTRRTPVDFRPFLQRHAELLRTLPQWEVRLLVPAHLKKAAPLFETAVRQELAMPLPLRGADELRWYFRERQLTESGHAASDAARLRQAARQFHAPRFRALYRLWKQQGDALVHATVSPVLSDALARRTGGVKRVELPSSYQHLAPLVGSA
jgi:hypothetical protein